MRAIRHSFQSRTVVLRVDTALFSNVVTSVQRTANLPGGAVRNLPGGASIEGMKGVESFAAEVADAKKEFELGRLHNALARVRQIEMQFNSIAGRWNAQAGGILASARQGKQAVPAQKLNEVKNAQAKMRQITAPATKSFRDLITALEHAVASQSDAGKDSGGDSKKTDNDSPSLESSLGKFADKYQLGPKLEIKISAGRKRHISPKLEEGCFYFIQGIQPPTVVRVREIRSKSVLVYDALHGNETLLDSVRLRTLLGQGIWLLTPSSRSDGGVQNPS